VPHSSRWPFLGSIALFTAMVGLASWFNELSLGKPLFFFGLALMAAVLFSWFRDVIRESIKGYYNQQVDTSFRMGMVWFIFSEVMFFAAFFGALFYARQYALPWLSGEGDGVMTNALLWNGYTAGWPTNGPGGVGGSFQTVPAWGLPLLNTLILLSSA
jgi:cytochrome c oxidase subunit 3